MKENGKPAETGNKRAPPIAGTVAGRVPVPAISQNDDPASPGAEADKHNPQRKLLRVMETSRWNRSLGSSVQAELVLYSPASQAPPVLVII